MRLKRVGARLDPRWLDAAPAEWRARWNPVAFDLGDGVTEMVAMGEGPPLLLLPPLPGWKEAWIAVAPLLARRFRVLTFDLRAGVPGAQGWARLVADVDRFVDAHVDGRLHVVGHSLGGALAQRWALGRPERVATLVLSSTFARVGHAGGQAWKRWLEQPVVIASQRWLPERAAAPLARRLARRSAWVYDPRCGEPVLAMVRHGLRTVPLRLARERVGLAFAHDLRDELPRLRVPVKIVVGELDPAFWRRSADELAHLLPHAERAVVPGAGHLHPLSHPEWLAARLESWLGAEHGARS